MIKIECIKIKSLYFSNSIQHYSKLIVPFNGLLYVIFAIWISNSKKLANPKHENQFLPKIILRKNVLGLEAANCTF